MSQKISCRNPMVELADGEYMTLKAEIRHCHPHAITIAIIERRFKLKPGQLANYRANTYSRRRLETALEKIGQGK